MKKAVVAVLILVTVALTAFAQQSNNDKRVLAKLKNQKVTINFQETALSEVVTFFRDITGLNIIEAPGCLSDTFVNLRLKEIRLENALELALEPHGLDFMVRNGAVYIATKDEIYRLRGGSIRHRLPDLKPDRVLLILKEGSRIEGKVSFEKWKLKTAYGELTIPANEIRGITIAREMSEGTVDEVETIRFSVTGRLDIDKLEIDTGKGKLTVPKKDIRIILFSKTLAEKTCDVKATGEWLDTGIYLGEGSGVKIETTGKLVWGNLKTDFGAGFYPDGSSEYRPDMWKNKKAPDWWQHRSFSLIARIGKNGKLFRPYRSEGQHSCKFRVTRKGTLFLKVRIPKGAKEATKTFKGAYKTKVIVEK